MASLPARLGLAAGAGVFALIVTMPTLWFLGDALVLLLEEKGFSPPAATGLTGLVGLILAAIIGFCAKLAMRPPRRTPAPIGAPPPGINGVANGIAADLGALAAQQIVNTSRAHPYSTMGAALAAGIAVGAVPELRRAVTGLFKQ
jgi:hypothetical protein